MKTMVNQSLEAIINRYLALDPESKNRLMALEDKVIMMEFKGLPLNFLLKITEGRIVLENHDLLSEDIIVPDVVIKGTPLSLLHMSLAKHNRKQFFAEDVIIEGDLELGQQIIDLFDEMDIDWEEYVSQVIGDVPAHQFGRIARGIKNFVGRTKETIFQNVSEYVHEETLTFPPQEALQDLFQDIDVLRMDVDRLAERIRILAERCGAKS